GGRGPQRWQRRSPAPRPAVERRHGRAPRRHARHRRRGTHRPRRTPPYHRRPPRRASDRRRGRRRAGAGHAGTRGVRAPDDARTRPRAQEGVMTYEVTVETLGTRTLAAVRRRIAMNNIAKEFRPALDRVWAFLKKNPGLRTDGHNVFLYHHENPEIIP